MESGRKGMFKTLLFAYYLGDVLSWLQKAESFYFSFVRCDDERMRCSTALGTAGAAYSLQPTYPGTSCPMLRTDYCTYRASNTIQ